MWKCVSFSFIFWRHFYYINKFIYFNWRLITLQYCSGFCHTLTWISHDCTHVPHPESPSFFPPHPITQGCPTAPAFSALFHASNLDWCSISYMVIYMFQFYSLKSSHPCLLPQSPTLCSLHLCLFCCPNIGSSLPCFWITYVCINILYWCYSFWLTSLYIIGSSFIHLIRTLSDAFLLMAE